MNSIETMRRLWPEASLSIASIIESARRNDNWHGDVMRYVRSIIGERPSGGLDGITWCSLPAGAADALEARLARYLTAALSFTGDRAAETFLIAVFLALREEGALQVPSFE